MGCSVVSLRRWNGNKHQNIRTYLKSEIDAIAVYLPKIDRICWIPSEKFHGKANLYIRIDKPKNGQTQNLLMAEDYFW